MAKKSSLKRARQARVRNLRNKRIKKALKTTVKKLDATVGSKKDKKEIDALFNKTVSMIDKAVSKGVIHKNTAGRKKSQAAKKVIKNNN